MQIINHDLIRTLPVKQGEIQRDLSQDILKLAVVERYGKTGGVGVGSVQGFTLKKGALAYSMSHDHHNIVTVGVSDSDMAITVNEVARLHVLADRRLDERMWRRRGDAPSLRHE